MGSTIYRVDVVRKRVDLLVVPIVVLNGDFNREAFAFFLKIDWFVVKRTLVLVEVLHEFSDPTLVVELVRTFRLFPLVFNRDANAFVEKSLLTQTFRELVNAKLRMKKYLRVE